jgi:hypothetical protein
MVADLTERVSPKVPGDNFWRDPASGFSDAFFRTT